MRPLIGKKDRKKYLSLNGESIEVCGGIKSMQIKLITIGFDVSLKNQMCTPQYAFGHSLEMVSIRTKRKTKTKSVKYLSEKQLHS